MKRIGLAVVAFSACVAGAGTVDWPAKKLGFEPVPEAKDARSTLSDGRVVLKFSHAPDPSWAAETPKGFLSGLENAKRRDHFAVVLPKGADEANPPAGRALVVVLHGRNGGRFMNASASCLGGVPDPNSPFYAPPDAYALGCDALANLLSDIWYGSMPPPKTIYSDSPGNLAFAAHGDSAGDYKALGMTLVSGNWTACDYTHWGNVRYAGLMWESNIFGDLFDGPRKGKFPHYRSAPEMTCVKWNRSHENAVMKRILDEIEWTVRKYGIDRDRIYLTGNSMGGQAALALGLTHGEVFAAVNANVPATIWYPVARAGFVDDEGEDVAAESFRPFAADPAVIFDWSGSNDAWSREHDVLYRNLNRFRFAITGWWGDYGHCGSVTAARAKNDLVCKGMDFFSIRRDRAYVVFSNADCNDPLPWPERACSPGREGEKVAVVDGVEIAAGKLERREGSPAAGQWNGWLKGAVTEDAESKLVAEVWIATEAEVPSAQFRRPATAKADVSFRRLRKFPRTAGAKAKWTCGSASGEIAVDATGAFTVPGVALAAGGRTVITLESVR